MIDFVVESNISVNTIRQPSLQRLLELVSKRKVNMPTTKYFMQNLVCRYEKVHSKLITILEEQKYVCITADVWSSRAQAYLGMTVHYLTNTFKRKSFLLAFRSLKGRQTHDILAAEINKVLEEFKLPNYKVTHIITDGGSAFCKAFKRFGKGNDTYVEDIQSEDIINTNVDGPIDMPYVQNEDGEFFISNVLSFLASDGFESVEDFVDESGDSASNLPSPDVIEIEHEPTTEDVLSELFPESIQLDENNRTEIFELPPQRRCLSHLLNLISSDFEKVLGKQTKTALINAINKVHGLWTFTH